jgi:tetraacyldisaccharide 4'-kinase
MGMDWSNQRVVAFAGIGRPEKFFETLRGLGAHLVKTESLADHQTLPNRLLQRLAFDAFSQNAQLVTTEKDAARLPLAFRQKVLTLVVRLRVYDWGPLDLAISKLGL